MKGRSNLTCEFNSGNEELVYDEDLNDSLQSPGPDWQQALLSRMTTSKYFRHAAVSLAVLAAVQVVINICLGIHYNDVRGKHLTIEDTEWIYSELTTLQTSYKKAMDSMKKANTQVRKEREQHKEMEWELEHHEKRHNDYEAQIDKIRKDVAALGAQFPMIHGGCRHCPAGWLLMKSMCYFFSVSQHDAYRSWKDARDFCTAHGGDLIVIDTQDKQNMTVSYLRTHETTDGFWIGLRDVEEEGAWTWLDGSALVEGYWKDGEPNDRNQEDCAVVTRQENFFKSWNDVGCSATMRWICEKAAS